MTLDEANKILNEHFTDYTISFVSYYQDAWVISRIANHRSESSIDAYKDWSDVETYIEGLKHGKKT